MQLKHEEQIRILFEKNEKLDCRIDNLSEMKDTLIEMRILMGVMVEHSKKQDDINEKQNHTLINMNNSLISMNNTILSVDNRVQTLELRASENERKHMIDTRDLQRERYKTIIQKYGIPIGIVSAVALLISELAKAYKNFM